MELYFFSDLSTESTDDKFLNNLAYLIQQNETNKVSTFLNSNNEYIELLISNELLGKLYSNSFENWFDIEQAYYEELKDIYASPKENHNDKLKILNKNLQEIKEALKKYLKDKIEPTPDRNIHYSLYQHITDRQNISFINFNYTNTINCYRHSVNLNLNKNIHIHNSLSEDIIFGYGDDTDEMYQKMKASKNNSFLKYFKTFDYLKSKNYRKVLNQLATFDKYDVLVIGHSLGGTDKTILKTILDDDSCQNIELLKRSDFDTDERYEELNLVEKEQLKADNLFELYANLARIFDSEASLREKVIPFEWSINFPVMANYDYTKIQKREKELFIIKSNHITLKTRKRKTT
ncbi:hypothetical protein G1L02_11735 [Tenacibaculum finnmarkense]|uniref:AbiH family protein n=1 Tax=Tenacibaculum finnmarkense TaxID=2781243 RepID=UPI001EFBC80E|nr:AbiH family protein [Tenacibaculum finnmarkense]MCG8883824.1 hypothetical protein [Tenacibaculum finnmarkense]